MTRDAAVAELRSQGFTFLHAAHDLSTLRRQLCGGLGISQHAAAELAYQADVVDVLNARYERWRVFSTFSRTSGKALGWHRDPVITAAHLTPRLLGVDCDERTHAIWALDDFTEENGATEIRDDSGNVVRALMPAGSCFLFVASRLDHQAGSRRSGTRRAFLVVDYRCQRRA